MLDKQMRMLRQFGVLVVLVASCLTPAMACMLPGAELTTEERACCRTMQNQCEQMEMPASHGCCHKVPPNVFDSTMNEKAVGLHPVAFIVAWLASPASLNPSSAAAWAERHDFSPPQSPPSTISILRI